MDASLIYPHQLFANSRHLKGPVFLIEDELFFRQYSFHKSKLLLHRASMKAYADALQQQNHTVEYIDSHDKRSITKNLFEYLSERNIGRILYVDPVDYLLTRRLRRYATKHTIELVRHDTPNFICTEKDISDYFKPGKKYFLAAFYEGQRRRLDILMDGNQPTGGRWSFDTENREKMPPDTQIPSLPVFDETRLAPHREYVNTHFAGNYGSCDAFVFPVTRKEALTMLNSFLKHRFTNFGRYQDAIVKHEHFLFHSLLSSSINTGMLHPGEVVAKAVAFGKKNKVPLSSVEGFVRQVVGWREFIRAVYVKEGVRQRTTNFFRFNRKLPEALYTASTGIDPVDAVVRKVLQTGYAHHIERLMILGNFMLLCEIDPNEVYRWFMELFIDAYDWVMVPNVYGMSQFADGGLMSTKPYISSSNYIRKMGDFRKGPWCDIWDALFWRFMHVHRDHIRQNPRLALLLGSFDRMPAARRRSLLNTAEDFLQKLDKGETSLTLF